MTADTGSRAGPTISVVMPTYDTEEAHLREALDSVRAQRHSGWELCVVDDGSTLPHVRETLSAYASADARIRVELMVENAGISAASNRALGMCRGEYVAFLDHDDVLTPDALSALAGVLDADPSLDVVYSDQDKLSPGGERRAPFLKPDWSPVYALGAMYVGHLLVVRRSLLVRIGGFDSAFDTIQDFELLLRVSEHTDRIHHLPRILYHWRAVPGSIAAGTEEKSGVPALQAAAVTAHLRRRGIAAGVVPHPDIPHRVQLLPRPRVHNPLVSVIVAPSDDDRDTARCVDSVRERTDYPSVETIVPDPARSPSVAANRGVERAGGEYLLFLDGDTEVVERDWIERLLMYAEMPSVGVVGPLLVHPDGRVWHAGFALRRAEGDGAGPPSPWWHGSSPAEPLMRGAGGGEDGYYGSLSCAREVGATSAACMLVSRAVYERVGGFGEDYRAQYHDVDLCLRIRELGLEVVYTPQPRIVSRRPSPAGAREDMIDRALLVDSWFDALDRGDPYLNDRLSPAMR